MRLDSFLVSQGGEVIVERNGSIPLVQLGKIVR